MSWNKDRSAQNFSYGFGITDYEILLLFTVPLAAWTVQFTLGQLCFLSFGN